MDRALQFLVESQNSDGGWGYRVRGMSYVEPTAAALLALRDSTETTVTNRARDFLLTLQHPDGGWGIAAIDSESGWMSAWALIALADYAEARDAVSRGVAWLVQTSGFLVTDPGLRDGARKVFHIDSIVSEREVVFAEAHEYGHPPMNAFHSTPPSEVLTLRK